MNHCKICGNNIPADTTTCEEAGFGEGCGNSLRKQEERTVCRLCGKEFSSNVYELNRLCRLDDWKEPLSSFVGACLQRIKSENWIVVSYSDTGMNHNKPYLSKLAQENRNKAHKGRRSFNWKGGRIKDRLGYIQIWKPEHPNAKIAGYIHEHRLVISEKLGRPLLPHENIHHKNGKRDDNRIENLELWTTIQPAGKRPEDLLKFAKEVIKLYEKN